MNSYLAALGPALANHLWQSTAVGVSAWLLTLALRRAQARVRYSIWLAASIKFLVPFSLLISVGNLLPHAQQPVAPVVYSTMSAVEEPFTVSVPQVVDAPIHIRSVRERAEAALPLCLGILWLIGVGTVLLAWWNRWRIVARSASEATPATGGRELEILRRLDAGAAHPVRLLMSAERMEPGIFGVWRPVLVWPAQLSACLEDHHIEAIVAHELTHVRRGDNLTALLHMLVEAAFWFHPLVWWMERQMVKEREQACDEAVVEMGGSAETYAESLLKTCWFCIESPLACVAGVTGADLKRRVADIMTGRALMRMTWPKKLLLAAVAVGALLAPVLLGQAKAAQHFMQSAMKMAPKPVRQMAASASAAQEAAANDSDSGAAFDVATIRPMNDKDRHWFGFRLAPSGRLTVSAVELTGLVGFSSAVSGDVSGGPAWADTQKWDITAEADTSKIPNWNQLTDEERMNRIRPMLRKLVVERFHLKGHMETRLENVYAMVPAKHGVKLGGALKRANPPPAHTDPDEVDARLRMNKPPTQAPAEGYAMSQDGTWWFRSVGTNFLAGQLAANCRIDGRTVDQSGLKGYYDLTFKPDRDPDAPSIQDQVEVQLGLRFEAKKVPMPTYVIDSAEKPSVDGAELQPQDSQAAAPATGGRDQFEASTVKPTDMHAQGIPHGTDIDPGGIVKLHSLPLKTMIAEAFNLQYWQIEGGEPWMEKNEYEVTGKPPDDYARTMPDTRHTWYTINDPRLRAMLQALLVQRFSLKVHRSTKPGRVYLLERTGGPLELKPNETAPKQQAASGGLSSSIGFGAEHWVLDDTSMSQLADFASGMVMRRPVVDRTGLTGAFDFRSEAEDWNTHQADPNGSFLRMLKQAGLKLEPSTGDVETLVIDHAELPSPN